MLCQKFIKVTLICLHFVPLLTQHHHVILMGAHLLTELLTRLTQNEVVLKNPFDAATKICNIPAQLFDNVYIFESFDRSSLFTNLPLNRTVNIISDRLYNENLVDTQLRKRTLKKLIKDTCSKIVFTANKKLYQQIDGVSMGSYLGLANVILANVIMTELEQKVVKQLIDDKTLMLCGRYVDDTSVVIKPEDLNRVRNALNNFHLNLKFTRDTFNDIVPHFSDMEIHPSRLGI